jgi:translation initiation factor IF-2
MMKKDANHAQNQSRPPIVTVLGHVDHGKTTLLDFIRNTKITQKEAGGITQSTAASVVSTKEGQKITFIDTPGHAVFSEMRSRGAKIADIVILVVAADDGVKPQTKEALEYIFSAGIPFIVAATKIDLPNSSVETVKAQLANEGVLFEGQGGEVPVVEISGKTGQGVENLLEMISLLAELHDIRGDKTAPLEAMVIESSKDKRGTIVSVVVKNGILKIRDELIASTAKAKVKGLFDFYGQTISEVYPGEPVQVLGFSSSPKVGDKVWHLADNKDLVVAEGARNITPQVSDDEVAIVVKTENSGALEALLSNLPDKVAVIASGVGEVTEADVFLAKPADSIIVAFESRIPPGVAKLAETENVNIKKYNIIYKLFEDLEELIKEKQTIVLGRAKVTNTFPFSGKKVAGCQITEGRIRKGEEVILERQGKEIGKVKITSIRKGKQEASEVKQGEECGILFFPQLDFNPEDELVVIKGK